MHTPQKKNPQLKRNKTKNKSISHIQKMWSLISIALILLISSLNARRSRLILSEEVDCSRVNDCSGVADGNYRACGNCHGFVQCANEILYTQDCHPLSLFFDHQINACTYESSFPCGECPVCVDDCSGKANGNYRKCGDCTKPFEHCTKPFEHVIQVHFF
eukprot:UN10029